MRFQTSEVFMFQIDLQTSKTIDYCDKIDKIPASECTLKPFLAPMKFEYF